jgi:hypothetical protein
MRVFAALTSRNPGGGAISVQSVRGTLLESASLASGPMCRLRAPKSVADGGDGLLPTALDGVGIQVQRCGPLGVPKATLHRHYIATVRDRPRRERVTQRVQRNFGGQLGRVGDLSKCLRRRVELKRAPVLIRKGEALVEIFPGLAASFSAACAAFTLRRTATASRSSGTCRLFPDFVPLSTTAVRRQRVPLSLPAWPRETYGW